MTNKISKPDRRRKSVLILECDTRKLRSQNLSLGEDLKNYVKLAFPTNPIDLIETNTEADLLKQIAELFKTGQFYKNVIIIGHSNRQGLQLSSDRFVDWTAVANWLSPFKPNRIILLACEAGRWLPCAALFNSIYEVKEIFGSPVPASKNQQYIILGTVLHILGAKKQDNNLIQLMQMANFVVTKGVMLRRTRSEYEAEGDEEGEVWTNFAEPLLDQIIKRLR